MRFVLADDDEDVAGRAEFPRSLRDSFRGTELAGESQAFKARLQLELVVDLILPRSPHSDEEHTEDKTTP